MTNVFCFFFHVEAVFIFDSNDANFFSGFHRFLARIARTKQFKRFHDSAGVVEFLQRRGEAAAAAASSITIPACQAAESEFQ